MSENKALIESNAQTNIIESIGSEILKLPQLNDEDLLLEEYISGGVYIRKIMIPRDVALTGRIYKYDHMEIMPYGKISLLSCDGTERNFEGFNILEAKAGKQQAGYAEEETIWVTANQVPSFISLEDALDFTTVKTREELLSFYILDDIADYTILIEDIGLTEDDVQEKMLAFDVIDLPEGYEHIYLDNSKIQGKGIFSKRSYSKGDLIYPPVIDGVRTIAGRYSNHSARSNTMPVIISGEVLCIAKGAIIAGDELTINYRDVFQLTEMGELS